MHKQKNIKKEKDPKNRCFNLADIENYKKGYEIILQANKGKRNISNINC